MQDSCFNEYEDYSLQASIPRTIPVCILKSHTKAITSFCRISYAHYTLLLSYPHSMGLGVSSCTARMMVGRSKWIGREPPPLFIVGNVASGDPALGEGYRQAIL